MTDEKPAIGKSSGGKPWQVATIVAAVLLLWFAIGNAKSVSVEFWVSSVRAPLIIVIAASAVLGAGILALWSRARTKK